MSETKLVSPLLDGFTLGAPISNHSGICCCPAMKENSDHKYIVKVIAVPASQVQLDALLVTGAYKDPAAALDYFRRQAESISEEAQILQQLSRLDGFLPYEGCQVTPMRKNRLGYHIYLLSDYKMSLEKFIRRHPVTHLEAVNMALDICSALTMCRQAGYIYIDLKPTNIFVGDDKVFRISDLGFVALDSMKYTSLPEKYISPYSAPETHDAMCTINETADTYALGMILYRIFNNGKLPEMPQDPAQALTAPARADEEMAGIILKACAPNPEERWQDPAQMGQALVAYMQRNCVNDVPVATEAPNAEAAPAETVTQETVRFVPGEFSAAVPDTESERSDSIDKTILIPIPLEETVKAEVAEEPDPAEQMQVCVDDVVPTDPDIANILSTLEEPEPLQEPEPAEEAPVPQPEPVPEPEPELEPVAVGAESHFDLENELNEVNSLLEDAAPAQPRKNPAPQVKPTPVVMGKKKKGGRNILVIILLLILLAAAGFCGYCFYQFIYLQTIDSISIDGTQSQMTVKLETEASDDLLIVVCTDTFGNTKRQRVKDGQAVFTNLTPNSLYKVSVEITGTHKLMGQISDVFTTESQTEVIDFTAVTGPEDGSALLTFTVHGHEPDKWIVSFVSNGDEPTITETFSGHSATVRGLTVGKQYTVILATEDGIDLIGQNSITFDASGLVSAENLSVISRVKGATTVSWEEPEGFEVENWIVHCFGEGYDETQTLTETTAVFEDTEDGVEYTIEVTAEGMTQPARITISANPVSITSMTVNDKTPQELTITWQYTGSTPEEGWILLYTMDGSVHSNVVKCKEASAVISPRVPGASYQFTVQSANGSTVFNNSHSYKCPAGEPYVGHAISAYRITPHLRGSSGEFTNRFGSNERISITLEAGVSFYLDHEDVNILFVIRDASGKVLPNLVQQVRYDWHDLWVSGDYHQCELSVPNTPPLPGDYRLDLYFNGSLAASQNFTIT